MKFKRVYCVLSDYQQVTSIIKIFSSLKRAKEFMEWHIKRDDGNEYFYIHASRLEIQE